MSKFTGKCDLYDLAIGMTIEQKFDNRDRFFINDKELKIKRYKDLIPYFTHMINETMRNEFGGINYYLSNKTIVDEDERVDLMYIKYVALNIKRNARRKANKKEIDDVRNYVYQQMFITFNNLEDREVIENISNDILKYSDKANPYKYELNKYKKYRELLIKEMIYRGYKKEIANEIVYKTKYKEEKKGE